MPTITANPDQFYQPDEFAKLLGKGRATIFRWIKQDRIVTVKFGHNTLIPKSELARLRKLLAKEGKNV